MMIKVVRLAANATSAALSKQLPCSCINLHQQQLKKYIICKRLLSTNTASTTSSSSSSSGDANSTKSTTSSGSVLDNKDSLTTTGVASATAVPLKRIKHKTPKKKASAMLAILQKLEFENLKKGRPFVDVIKDIEAGDTVEIEKLPYMSADPKTESVKIRGLVIAKVNKMSDTRLKLINSELNTPIERDIPIFNPTILNVTILQKRWLKGGVKRIKRKKLYYMLERDPKEYTVK